jgi:hypothetical protein
MASAIDDRWSAMMADGRSLVKHRGDHIAHYDTTAQSGHRPWTNQQIAAIDTSTNRLSTFGIGKL